MEGTQESQDLFCMFKSSNIARVKLRECIPGSVLWTSHLESNSVDALVDGCSMSKHWPEYSFESLVVVGASALLVVAFSTPPTSTPADRQNTHSTGIQGAENASAFKVICRSGEVLLLLLLLNARILAHCSSLLTSTILLRLLLRLPCSAGASCCIHCANSITDYINGACKPLHTCAEDRFAAETADSKQLHQASGGASTGSPLLSQTRAWMA